MPCVKPYVASKAYFDIDFIVSTSTIFRYHTSQHNLLEFETSGRDAEHTSYASENTLAEFHPSKTAQKLGLVNNYYFQQTKPETFFLTQNRSSRMIKVGKDEERLPRRSGNI